jgi:broad specificity phosphatase PhoE
MWLTRDGTIRLASTIAGANSSHAAVYASTAAQSSKLAGAQYAGPASSSRELAAQVSAVATQTRRGMGATLAAMSTPEIGHHAHTMIDDDGDPRPELWLVRHGETEWARLGRHTGRTDVPLTDAGRAEARTVARKLRGHPFGLVLSSPLSRALETARLAGYRDEVETTPDLMEWDYGADEGLTTTQIRADRPDWSIWAAGPRGGETAAQVAARVDRVIGRVRAAEGDVLIFAHGHVLRILAARWLGEPPKDGRHYALSTATLSVLGWERDNPVIERWNEACGSPRSSVTAASARRS